MRLWRIRLRVSGSDLISNLASSDPGVRVVGKGLEWF